MHLLGFSDNSCFIGWGSQPHAQPQTGGPGLHIYIPWRQGGPAIPPGHWVSILVTSYDRHGLRWGYSCSCPPHGESITLYSAISHSHHCENLTFPKGSPYLFLHRCYFILDHEGEDIVNSGGFLHVWKTAWVGRVSKSQSGNAMRDSLPPKQKPSRFPALTFAANYIL